MSLRLCYGGSEGIYLDLWIEYYKYTEWFRSDIGTFKTLDESREAMHTMAGLLADFIIEGTAYVKRVLEEYFSLNIKIADSHPGGNEVTGNEAD